MQLYSSEKQLKTFIPMAFSLSCGAFNHLIFLCIFYYYNITPLVYFNCFSVVLFLMLLLLLTKRLLVPTTMVWGSLEVILHQIYAIHLLGWDYGFQYFLLVVTGFIMLGEFKNKLIPASFAIASLATLLLMYLYSANSVPEFSMIEIQSTLYIYNLISAALMLSLFVVMFAYTSQQHEQALLKTQLEYVKLLEQLKLSQQQAEDANNRKTRFLASASHDLRQPVHALELFSEALYNENLSKRGLETLTFLKDSVASLNELLTSLLDISRLDAGIVLPSFEKVDVALMVNRLSNSLKAQAENKNLTLRILTHSAWVYSDAVILENTLRNLLGNAIKYTNKGGILFCCRLRKEEVWVEVWDTGIGIPESEMNYILDEFYQIENQGRDRTQGLGLGLSIVNREMKILNHSLSFYSRVDKGTLVRIKLQRVSVPKQVLSPTIAVMPRKSRLAGHKIIIIDDDESILLATQAILEQWGCQTKTAVNLSEAMTLADKFIPDLIISDFRLREKMTGIEVIKQLRNKFQETIPAVLITGDTAPDRLQQAQDSGLLLLHKPVKPAKLRAAINQAIAEKNTAV